MNYFTLSTIAVVAFLIAILVFVALAWVLSLGMQKKPPKVPREPMGLADLQKLCFDIAGSKGWNDSPELRSPLGVGAQLANIHGEVSEALEEARRGRMNLWHSEGGKPEGFGVELGDIVIRTLHTAELLGIDLEELIRLKLEFNTTRELRHGGRLF